MSSIHVNLVKVSTAFDSMRVLELIRKSKGSLKSASREKRMN